MSAFETLTLDNVVCRRRFSDKEGWHDWDGELTEAQRASLVRLLGSGCRQHTKLALVRCFADNCARVKSYGILRRVHLEGDVASYCAGQDYPSELAEVRKICIASY